MDPVTFQQKWITRLTLKERTASQSHFNDLCSVLGESNPIEADPTGDFYTFERGAEKAGGAGDGWADVWYRGHFAWEYKGHKANLEKAYLQLLQYKDDLENPPLLIVSDLNVIEIHTNFNDTIKVVHRIDLTNFAEPKSLDLLRRVFTDPQSFKPGKSREDVTKEAAERFSKIALGLHQRGAEPAEAAHFLVQLLFCLFAEDVRLLPNKIFSKMIDAGLRRPDSFATRAAELLNAMNTGGEVAYEDIPRFNGGLFQTVHALELTSDEISILKVAAALDWSSIEPAIFGTLFERSLDPGKRAQLGAHYTGRKDIDRVVDPVVMQPLLRRWDEVRAKGDELKQHWNEARSVLRDTTKVRAARTRQLNDARKNFDASTRAFQIELSKVRILDPACGSGNFLYIALERLLSLEKEVMTYRANAGLPMGIPSIRPHQVLGLEINEYAHELAQVAIWIGYLQWMLGNGFGYSEPVLDPLDSIRLQDSLLDFSGDKVKEAIWPEADFIIGNPPFLGDKRMRRELGHEYVERLRELYASRLPGGVDLCCYFIEKARSNIETGQTRRAGLLATNSIRDGASRTVLTRIQKSGAIFNAWSDEPWVLDGAAVRISIIGFDDGTELSRHLNGKLVFGVNADLTSGVDVTIAHRLLENKDQAFIGVQKTGQFDVGDMIARKWLCLPRNPNGRFNSDVVKRIITSRDIVQRPEHRWIVDFGVKMSEEDAALYEEPFNHVLQNVKPVRINSREGVAQRNWWLHSRPRPEMRRAMVGLERYLATPRVAKHRVFVWLNVAFLPDSRLVAIANDTDYLFGVLSSKIHERWSLATASAHGVGNDPTYNAQSCFETFPLPWPPGSEPSDDARVIAIGEAAKRLNELRENWLNPEGASEAELKKRTLTNLYNARPQWLVNLHAALDRAVWDAYGWDDSDPAAVEEDVILSRLLQLNQERSA